MTNTDDLIRRLEAATGPDRELDWYIALLHFGGRYNVPHQMPRYTGSIDAALTLLPEEWSKWWNLGRGVVSVFGAVIRRYEGQAYTELFGNAATAPAAMCIAALRARAAQQS